MPTKFELGKYLNQRIRELKQEIGNWKDVEKSLSTTTISFYQEIKENEVRQQELKILAKKFNIPIEKDSSTKQVPPAPNDP